MHAGKSAIRRPPRRGHAHGAAPDRGQSFANLCTDARGAHFRRVVGPGTDAAQNPGRKEERQSIDQYRERRREPLNQCPGNSGTDELRCRIAHPDLGVRFDQIAAPDPFGHEDLVSRPTANGSESDEEPDRIEHAHGEHAEPHAKRHREQGQGARDVRPHDDRKLGHAVYQYAGEQAEERERQRLEGRKDAHFERCRVEQQRAGEGQRQEGDLPAEVCDGERGPQPHKIAVAPQPVERSGGIQSSK